MQLTPDKYWFRSANGLHLLAGSPLTSFTVTKTGASILDAIENGAPLPAGHEPLTHRLTATGAAHVINPPPAMANDITVVIPAFVRSQSEAERLQSLIHSLSGLTIVVVDDCSPVEFSLTGARIISNLENEGPGNSRNTGFEEVFTQFVAFVDTDTVVTTAQVLELAGYFADDRVSLVAPRVATVNKKTFLSDYESRHSPLDLGPVPSVVRPLSRVSYVPSAVLLARTESLRALGSFDDAMRLGEDVDLIWRAAKSEHMCIYVPSVVCEHEPRQSIRALLAQRFGYGSSAASLDRRHPFDASPLRSHLMLLLPALALLSGNLYSFIFLFPIATAYFLLTLGSTKLSLLLRLRVIAIGFRSTLSLTASAISRAWWPLFVIAGIFSVYPAAMLVFSVLVPTIFGLLKTKSTYPVQYFVVRILDNAFYGLGVWSGIIRTKNIRCLLPVITLKRSHRKQKNK